MSWKIEANVNQYHCVCVFSRCVFELMGSMKRDGEEDSTCKTEVPKMRRERA